jgi:hypothetical protein
MLLEPLFPAVNVPEAFNVVNFPLLVVVLPIGQLSNVPPDAVIVFIVGDVSVLLVSVSVVARPTRVSVASGKVTVLFNVCTPANVKVFPVVAPDIEKFNCFVLSA